MDSLKDSVFQRRSIRKYKDQPVSKETITELIRYAVAAPSAKNRQPWKFLVFEGDAKAGLLDAMEMGLNFILNAPDIPDGAKAGMNSALNTLRIMRDAPVIICVLNTNGASPFNQVDLFGRITEICDTLSIGGAIQNLLLKATEMGLGSLWIANTFFAHDAMTAYIGTEYQLASAIALGYADEEPVMRPRKKFEELIEFRK